MAIAFFYFVLAKFGLRPASINRSASSIWPPTGLALAVILLGGLRMGAPAEVFSGVMSLARSVLDPIDYGFLAERLDVA